MLVFHENFFGEPFQKNLYENEINVLNFAAFERKTLRIFENVLKQVKSKRH